MLPKKAQTSTEYLIILAIVVVIALVVVGVMGGVPTIGGGTSTKVSAGYWKTADVGVETSKINAATGGDDIVVFKNNMAETIEVTSIKVNNAELVVSSFTMAPSATKTLNASIGTGTAGDAFSYVMNATYNDKDNNLNGKYFSASEKLEGTFQ